MGGSRSSAHALHKRLRGETKVECRTGIQERTNKEGAEPLRGTSQEEENGQAAEQSYSRRVNQHRGEAHAPLINH